MFPNQRTFLILFIVLLVPGTNLLAQKAPGIIAGNILDASNQKALPQATVVLRSMKDSLLHYAVISDKNGGFQIQNIPFGYYQLTISAIGYRSKQLDSIYFRMERYDFNLGDLLLSTQAEELTEVVIYAEKPLIESKNGMVVSTHPIASDIGLQILQKGVFYYRILHLLQILQILQDQILEHCKSKVVNQ
jgi:hypothetical protein